MEQSYTDLSILKYLYKETGITERFEIEDAIENDKKTRSVFYRFYYAYKSLPKVLFRPSNRVVEEVLNFSNSYAI